MRTVAVVDYGMGNLRSVSQAVRMSPRRAGGFDVVVTAKPDEVLRGRARRAAGPGRDARLHARAARSGLQEAVLDAAARKPLMGVCVGMQMLLDRSEEGPTASARPASG